MRILAAIPPVSANVNEWQTGAQIANAPKNRLAFPRVRNYSEPFHTQISVEKGIGVIRVPPAATAPVGAEIRSTFIAH